MKRFAIIGNPLEHSLSPVMHEYLLQEIGQEGGYDRIQIDKPRLAEKLQELRDSDYVGFNVTIPFKQLIMSHLDQISVEGGIIGAINTVCIKQGKLFGYNTDSFGFYRSLQNKGIRIRNQSVVVLGAGGATRAVLFSLINSGANAVMLFNRTPSRAEKLAQEMSAATNFGNISVNELEENQILKALSSSQMIINTTSVGMWPDIETAPFTFSSDATRLTVVDLIYNPLQTRFLKSARDRGAKVVDGLDMFIFQGVESLRIWLQRPIQFDYERLRHYLAKQLECYGKN